ncbi:hypothetical protein ACJX0J_026468 [Zea mays]
MYFISKIVRCYFYVYQLIVCMFNMTTDDLDYMCCCCCNNALMHVICLDECVYVMYSYAHRLEVFARKKLVKKKLLLIWHKKSFTIRIKSRMTDRAGGYTRINILYLEYSDLLDMRSIRQI